MNDHYYSADPQSKHNIREFRTTFRGEEYTFQTDAGVFSKDHVDRGTKLLIDALDMRNVKSALDIGCGYGPIGIVMAKEAPECRVAMVDPNLRAVELAQENAEINHVQVEVRQGEGCLPFDDERFDLIVTNPPIRAGKKVVFDLVDQSFNHLNPGGRFLAVIRTQQGAASLAKKIEEVFGEIEEVEKGGGFRVLQGVKGNG
ncbi:MAG TPA: class I SAM-dependent methyltransferase [Bacillota bacterium]|nr:class I SAM-dependent methyltransferase [Bacillota bacterium]